MLSSDLLNQLSDHYPLIAALPARLQEAVREQGQRVDAPARKTFFGEDDPCDNFVMVTEGAVRVVKDSGDGREIVLYRVLPGDSCILTVSCLLGEARYPASGIVEGNLVGATIGKALFDQLIAESPPFRRFIFTFFAQRLTLLMALIEEITFHHTDARLAGLLLRTGPELHSTHQMLADELGSVREVISRILKDFESRSLVHLDRGQIRVLDSDALDNIARSLRDSSH
jgi:CRP/FNR family transcriptional regulator